jgi:hypothetical protein
MTTIDMSLRARADANWFCGDRIEPWSGWLVPSANHSFRLNRFTPMQNAIRASDPRQPLPGAVWSAM